MGVFSPSVKLNAKLPDEKGVQVFVEHMNPKANVVAFFIHANQRPGGFFFEVEVDGEHSTHNFFKFYSKMYKVEQAMVLPVN